MVATLRSIWRAWHGTQHVALGAASVSVLLLWNTPLSVPGRDDIAQIVWPLSPTFLSLACLTGARTAHHDAERLTPRGAALTRASYVVALAVFCAALLIPSGPVASRLVLARNDAFLCGLALLALELLPPAAAWTPLVVVPMLTWLLGSNGLGRAPEPWAVLLAPGASATAALAAVLALTGGAVLYIARPGQVEVRRIILRRRSVISGARNGR